MVFADKAGVKAGRCPIEWRLGVEAGGSASFGLRRDGGEPGFTGQTDGTGNSDDQREPPADSGYAASGAGNAVVMGSYLRSHQEYRLAKACPERASDWTGASLHQLSTTVCRSSLMVVPAW